VPAILLLSAVQVQKYGRVLEAGKLSLYVKHELQYYILVKIKKVGEF
jgi:hypothetical protein